MDKTHTHTQIKRWKVKKIKLPKGLFDLPEEERIFSIKDLLTDMPEVGILHTVGVVT